ncbi:MAG: alpha/beta hydrolase [Reyranella sp.]|uniref:alpha/beta fold hydrolase n=1 Tax=Reyranella sp. TaxID=1929291 RepID=UPI0027305692|nr:alpha/beta hydrolase [Reyranella sp.]MDP1963443.1 alpha/beta hydrolase [Reyranella sp.]MDP2376258.1 alpha/beta hydrolase [Reyranella sp.]
MTDWMVDGARSDIRAPDGTRLAVYEWGDPAGPEVVLIHGFAQSHLCFAPQLRSDLVRRCRVVAFDMRGHGASAQPADASAYQGSRVWADDIATVLAAKRLKRPTLVGWSMGGRIIRQYLMTHGDAAIAGINFVAAHVIEDPRCRGPGAPKPTPETQTLAEEIEATIAFLDACYGKKPSEADFRRALGYNMRVPTSVRRAISGWSTDAAPTIAALAGVRVPVLITHGRQDTVVLPVAAEMARAAMPHARLSWFDDCGHSPFCEDAPRFNRELMAFVSA